MKQLSAQGRIFVITEHLYKNHISGLTNKELAKLVGTSEANVCRDMAAFEDSGWVVRDTAGRWRLSPFFGGIAGQIMKSYQKAKLILTAEEARYASEMQ